MGSLRTKIAQEWLKKHQGKLPEHLEEMTILSASISGTVFVVEETLANTHFFFEVAVNGVLTPLTIDLSQPSALAAVQLVIAALAKESTITVLYDPASALVQQISWSRV
jgi:hypothetical protein